MPNENKCPLEFMGQLLKGTKKAFAQDEIRPVKVRDRRYITLKQVAKQVKNNDVYMRYLPDHPVRAGRQFVFNVINTIDPEYFRSAQAEAERLRIAKAKKEEEHKVEICPEMQQLLSQYVELAADKKSKGASLALLKMGAKKRLKFDRKPVPELKARIKQFFT